MRNFSLLCAALFMVTFAGYGKAVKPEDPKPKPRADPPPKSIASQPREVTPWPWMLSHKGMQPERIFHVNLSMKGEVVVMTLEGKPVSPAKLTTAIKELMRKTGKPEMHLRVTDDVHWEDEVKVYDAAKVAGVRVIRMAGK